MTLMITIFAPKSGKGPVVRTKLKNVKTGKVIDNTFSAGHKLKLQSWKRTISFVIKTIWELHFMNQDTFEQVMIQEVIGKSAD